MSGWIGVDLDGTLARYSGWQGELHIGEPVPAMVQRVKHWLDAGRHVKIFTARVWDGAKNLDGSPRDITPVRQAIESWCEQHLGEKLEVTCTKDYGMIALYDDRAFHVIPNTGHVLEPDDMK
jgi:translation initiation factor 2 alpha subunit (eIF-2alpha)